MEKGLGESMAASPYRLRHRRLMDTASAPASTPGHSGSNNGMTIMVSILVVVIICSLCYCVYCWRWRKRNALMRLITMLSWFLQLSGELRYWPSIKVEKCLLSKKKKESSDREAEAAVQLRLAPDGPDLHLRGHQQFLQGEQARRGRVRARLQGCSGRRRGDRREATVGEAWKLWNEDKAAEFVDASLAGSYSREEAWRCFHVGLLCVQENPELRPTMSNVVLMLISGDQTQMAAPAASPLFTRLKTPVSVSEFSLAMRTDTTKTQSVNEVSISMIEPR
ncbi:hypothetical protein EJB05_55220 [Eragrostis curvula]|uniref:S-locus receptor kinase C-terminal domain-containing protein n=1 Tax=Eragrostis curvula TaxID=38414 RepID=A0A5J9SK89_9POAL|nr:hypothetical protein EJB05_55220 [Eragrostis curvula]